MFFSFAKDGAFVLLLRVLFYMGVAFGVIDFVISFGIGLGLRIKQFSLFLKHRVLVLTAFCIYFIQYHFFDKKMHHITSHHHYLSFLLYADYNFVWVTSLVGCFSLFIWRNQFKMFVTDFLRILQRSRSNSRNHTYLLLTLKIGIFFALFTFLTILSYFDRNICNESSVFCSDIFTSILLVHTLINHIFLSCSLSLLRECFLHLNLKLSGLLPPLQSTNREQLFIVLSDFKNHFTRNKLTIQCQVIRSIKLQYQEVRKLSQQINSCFSTHCLMFCGICFLQITWSILSIINDFAFCTGNDCPPSLLRFLFMICWFNYYAFQVVDLTAVSHLLNEEAKSTGLIIYKMLSDETKEELKPELELFGLQVYAYEFHISALHCFTINNQLLYTMADGVTSVLILLLQFQTNVNEAE